MTKETEATEIKTSFRAQYRGVTLGTFASREEADNAVEQARKRHEAEVEQFGL